MYVKATVKFFSSFHVIGMTSSYLVSLSNDFTTQSVLREQTEMNKE